MIARVGRWLRERDRSLVGWDEIIDGGLPAGATVQAWQSSERIGAALALGADVIASPNEWLYLNRQASELPLNRVARFDPSVHAPSGGQGRILGIEAPLWTEHVTSATNAELMWWPRLLAVSEIAWHGPADTTEFASRVTRAVEHLRAAGIAVGPSDRGLVSLQFRYDSVRRDVLIAYQAIPGVTVEILGPGHAPRAVRDGELLPGPGSWQLMARTDAGRIGEARTIVVVDHRAKGKPIAFATATDARYPGTGAHTLVDGVRGTAFNDGFWNGWWGPDLDAAIDLGELTPVRSVALSLLEQVNSWIVYPDTLELHHSTNGTTWQLVQRKAMRRDVAADASSRELVSFDVPADLRTRWIRVIAKGGKRLPAWHTGAGQPAWVFADEIVVQ
jgi:hexosaminidase